MVFIKKLRARVKNGDVTASVRIWRTPRVKAGNHYRLDEGHIRVTSIRQIFREDLTDKLARDTGFFNLIDLMKTAKHGDMCPVRKHPPTRNRCAPIDSPWRAPGPHHSAVNAIVGSMSSS
jgi:hypothetical protein